MVNRERWTELAKLELELTAHGIFAGGKPEVVYKSVRSLVQEYRARLFHHGFSSKRLLETLRRELNEVRLAKQRLAKLDEMTV